MKKPRSTEEIQAQIAGLKAIKAKPTFRKVTAFGDDNVEAIDAQIEVLEERLTLDECIDKEDDGDWSEHASNSARDTADWLAGDTEDNPVDGWDGLH